MFIKQTAVLKQTMLTPSLPTQQPELWVPLSFPVAVSLREHSPFMLSYSLPVKWVGCGETFLSTLNIQSCLGVGHIHEMGAWEENTLSPLASLSCDRKGKICGGNSAAVNITCYPFCTSMLSLWALLIFCNNVDSTFFLLFEKESLSSKKAFAHCCLICIAFILQGECRSDVYIFKGMLFFCSCHPFFKPSFLFASLPLSFSFSSHFSSSCG